MPEWLALLLIVMARPVSRM